jgi:hypothetical protein
MARRRKEMREEGLKKEEKEHYREKKMSSPIKHMCRAMRDENGTCT